MPDVTQLSPGSKLEVFMPNVDGRGGEWTPAEITYADRCEYVVSLVDIGRRFMLPRKSDRLRLAP